VVAAEEVAIIAMLAHPESGQHAIRKWLQATVGILDAGMRATM